MMFRIAVFAVAVLLENPVMAAINRAGLDDVYVDARPGATLPMSLSFRDEMGRPVKLADAFEHRAAVLIFADYTCHTLCGPILDFATAALQESELRAGTDYSLIVIGLDPKDGLDSARAMRTSHLDDGGPIARTAVFLTGTAETIAQATAALGYHFAYDAENDQFAHPAAAFVLTREGKVTRVLSGLGLSGSDMRLALIDAGQGKIGSLADRLRLLCYGYDPVLGIYTARINLLLEISGALTLVAMGGGILVMRRMTRPSP